MSSDSSQNAPSFPGRRDILHQSGVAGGHSPSAASSAQLPKSPSTEWPGSHVSYSRTLPTGQSPTLLPPPPSNVHYTRPYTTVAGPSRAAEASFPNIPYRHPPQHPETQTSWSSHYAQPAAPRYPHANVAPVAGPSNITFVRAPASSSASPPYLEPTAPPSRLRTYIGVRDIPDQGRFHVYDDGFQIPVQIEGEEVNPAWGLTKANKPRKRLALACISCRCKKIKCDPGINGCLQCEKANIVCRRGSKRFGLVDEEPQDQA